MTTTPSGAQTDGARTVVASPAKLTLSLAMTGIRSDGFHLIDAEMVSLDVADSLTITPIDGARGGGHRLTVTGRYASGVPTDSANLVWRALDLARPGEAFDVVIDKQIPHGGGLGGGSTNAAAVLRWAGWGRDEAALAAAALLGADIPFCLIGGRARVRGIGESVELLPALERELDITLVIPPLQVSTPAAYRAFDELHGVGPGDDMPTGHGGEMPSLGHNDLEPAARAVEPRLKWWKDAIAERVGHAPTLAGSGATWFVVGKHDNALADLVDEGGSIVLTRTVTKSDGAAF